MTSVGSRCPACLTGHTPPDTPTGSRLESAGDSLSTAHRRQFMVALACVLLLTVAGSAVIGTLGLAGAAIVAALRRGRGAGPLAGAVIFSWVYWTVIAPRLVGTVLTADGNVPEEVRVPVGAVMIAFFAAAGFVVFVWRPAIRVARQLLSGGAPVAAGTLTGCGFGASAAAWLIAAVLLMLSF